MTRKIVVLLCCVLSTACHKHDSQPSPEPPSKGSARAPSGASAGAPSMESAATGAPSPNASTDPLKARQAALREAQEFGMVGVMNPDGAKHGAAPGPGAPPVPGRTDYAPGGSKEPPRHVLYKKKLVGLPAGDHCTTPTSGATIRYWTAPHAPEVSVQVVSPGKHPRQLHYALTPGLNGAFIMDQKAGSTTPRPGRGKRESFRIRCSANDRARLEVSGADAAFKEFDWFVIDDRGRILAEGIAGPKAEASAKQQTRVLALLSYLAPLRLPDTPIGLGGHFRIQQKSPASGTMIAEHTVTYLDDQAMTVKTVYSQKLAAKAPPGARASHGKGETDVWFDRVYPVSTSLIGVPGLLMVREERSALETTPPLKGGDIDKDQRYLIQQYLKQQAARQRAPASP